MGVATDPYGNVYVADTGNYRIAKIDTAGRVTNLAGIRRFGTADGPGPDARFNLPSGVCYDSRDGGLFIMDTSNNMIRKYTSDGEVITLAGTRQPGHLDGMGDAAQLYYPYGCDLDAQGRLWIADWLNQSVRMLDTDGEVKTIAGWLPESYMDGPARYLKLKGLMNVRVAPNGWVYLADTDNERIRVLVP
jgi:sugar lactone lactonase YvrE